VNRNITKIKDVDFNSEQIFKEGQFSCKEKMIVDFSEISKRIHDDLWFEEIRFKNGKLNEKLMSYIRLY
jgi:hypothetical protein